MFLSASIAALFVPFSATVIAPFTCMYPTLESHKLEFNTNKAGLFEGSFFFELTNVNITKYNC